MSIEEIIQAIRDVRDNTPCDEDSHRHCGCERFDLIIDELNQIKDDEQSKQKRK